MSNQRSANYGFSEFVINTISYIYTKLFWKNARLIRQPIRVRGKECMRYGKGFTTGYSCRIEMNGNKKAEKLVIGENCIMGDYIHIVANYKVKIGNNVLMASRVFISDSNHGNYSGIDEQSYPNTQPNDRPMLYKEVVIGDNVWIGENVAILAGVKIGNGCIIGANAVVTKNIPDACIVVGNPGEIIKKYNFKEKRWVKYESER
jgi:acetyltransferase-like isoleucine patch superfamily enzyme